MANSTGRSGAGSDEPARPAVQPPPGPPPENHGRTSAAWVTVTLITLGGIITAVAMIAGSLPVSIAGGVVVVLGLVAGRVMRAMGLGQRSPQTTARG